MLSLLLAIPIVGPALLLVILALVLAWSGLIGGGGDSGAAERAAGEQARCEAALPSRPAGC